MFWLKLFGSASIDGPKWPPPRVPESLVIRFSRASTLTLPLLLAAVACDGAAVPEWCVAPDGAELRVAQEPAGWSTPPELRTAWRIDGSEPGRELMLPTSAAISDEAARIAIADIGLRQVVVVGLDGEWIGRWGRSGQGPGELRAPYAVAWREGGGLLVYDPAASKLVVFDSAGTTLDDRPVDPAFTAALGGGARSIQLAGSGLLLAEPGASMRGEGDTRTHAILRGGLPGTGVDTVLKTQVPAVLVPGAPPMSAPGFAVPLGAIDGDSIMVLAGDSPEYRVRVYRDGRLSHVICRDVRPQPFTEAEAEPTDQDVPEPVVTAMASAGRPATPASIGRVVIDEEQRIWVQRDRPRALTGLDFVIGRSGALFDVFDRHGVFLGEVRLPRRVRFLGATDDLIIGLASSELDELSIVALEFEPGETS